MADFGRYLTLIIVLLSIAWLVAFAFRGSLRRKPRVADGPEDEPYRVYTRDFDLELRGADVVAALPEASPDRERSHLHGNPSTWKASIVRTNALLKRNDDVLWAQLPGLRDTMRGLDPGDVAIALLIDQSGSMKGEPIVHAAAAADLFARLLAEVGIRNEVLGFSTAGWRGGRAYEAWKRAGRPERPGRLCALMHVVYKSVEEPALSEAAREAVVHPDLLRENVDGEAVLWARDRLAAMPARHRLLLVLSDGAPVDDATLEYNGPSILGRHIVKVLAEVEAEGLIIGGVGLNHRVDRYYPRSEAVTALDRLPEAMVRVLERMLVATAG
jgi:cobaltochelatase CobT